MMMLTLTATPTARRWFDHALPAVRDAVTASESPAAKARSVAGVLQGRLPGVGILTPDQLAGSPDRYQQHVLYVEPGGDFSVTALVWRPGQQTTIHDHVCWCAVGVLQGVEHEITYLAGMSGQLIETGQRDSPSGDVSYFAPPGDIHRVRNIGTGVAVSLHVYGADISDLGTSVRRVYS
jgi:predicted metal-dependent enzyme (double-stranded beta helix superfamily)